MIPIRDQILNQVIHSSDWLMSVLIIACVVGIFAALNGIKAGWLGCLSALFGLILKSALSVTWVYWLSGLVLMGVVLAALASIIMKNQALKEIIQGAQELKNTPDSEIDTTTGGVNTILKKYQSKDTQRLVLHQKAALKLRGAM